MSCVNDKNDRHLVYEFVAYEFFFKIVYFLLRPDLHFCRRSANARQLCPFAYEPAETAYGFGWIGRTEWFSAAGRRAASAAMRFRGQP